LGAAAVKGLMASGNCVLFSPQSAAKRLPWEADHGWRRLAGLAN